MKFPKLCEPGKIGNLTIKNRMVVPAQGTNFAGPNHEVTDRIIDYYVERAKGGAGLIVVENTLVAPVEKFGSHMVSELTMYHPSCIPGFRLLTDAVHEYDTKIAIQINYPGGGIDPFASDGVQAVTASPVSLPGYFRPILTRGATIEEIHYLIEQYGKAATIAKMAGFDGIEVHCTHGYGIAGFSSQYMNQRNDLYGGTFENRMRFGTEIVRRVREAVGADFPVWCRISLYEMVQGGANAEECLRIAQTYEAEGVVALSLSSGSVGEVTAVQNRYMPRAFQEPYLENMRNAVSVPLMVAGSFNNPEDAERVLRDGKVDFICIGRGTLADPEYPKKVMEGRPEDIRKCLRCVQGCIVTLLFDSAGIDCAINTEVGNEVKKRITRAEKSKKVLVVGGGPGGMEAARVAALRGHDVTLCEKNSKLGGALIPGSVPYFKVEHRWLIEWFSTQLKKLGVKVELDKEVTQEVVKRMKPDVVIVATGAVHVIPDYIRGAEKAVTAVDVLLGNKKVGDEVIVLGGGEVGCETALHLAENGKKVSIISASNDIALDMNVINRPFTMLELAGKGVTWVVKTQAEEITAKGVNCINSNLERKTFSADTVVLAKGMKPDDRLVQALKGKAPEVYAIGDCVKSRDIKSAISEGSLIARRI